MSTTSTSRSRQAATRSAGRPAVAEPIVQRLTWSGDPSADRATLLEHEWLVTNGLGGYASGTIPSAPTRRYHGLLVAALPAPFGRMMMLTDVAETLHFDDGRVVRLGGEERRDHLTLHGAEWLREFRLEEGLPVWIYEIGATRLEKRLVMPHRQNTTLLRYQVEGDESLRLCLRPLLRIRSHDAPVDVPLREVYRIEEIDIEAHGADEEPSLKLLIGSDRKLPELRLSASGCDVRYADAPELRSELLYRVEERRGYAALGELWSPGELCATPSPGESIGLCASSDAWGAMPHPLADEPWRSEHERRQRLLTLAGPAASDLDSARLVLAADQFIIDPATRLSDTARAHASGEEARSVIAGYHWFTDWGRDTMISLEGLTLTTGRHREAAAILATFARHARDGLIPNLFPEGESEGLYHTADATLWFFHAVARYTQLTGDGGLSLRLRSTLHDIVRHHVRGTHFGIGVDPDDGLLRQGAEGYQLTWMDAKVEDWVVTPRRGKAVEINALWYNALRVLLDWEQAWADTPGDDLLRVDELRDLAERAHASFNRRFWFEEGGYLYDVVDGEQGDDTAFRPNQILAVSLPHPVLDRARWEPVVTKVRERLLTPVGLRSLAREHPDYKETYHGDLRTRDAAYHQGTVWSWLIGPFVDAWLRLHPDDLAGARAHLEGLIEHLEEAGLGSVSEVFDAEEPFHPRGCIAQAWGVAELLRCLVKTGTR